MTMHRSGPNQSSSIPALCAQPSSLTEQHRARVTNKMVGSGMAPGCQRSPLISMLAMGQSDRHCLSGSARTISATSVGVTGVKR